MRTERQRLEFASNLNVSKNLLKPSTNKGFEVRIEASLVGTVEVCDISDG